MLVVLRDLRLGVFDCVLTLEAVDSVCCDGILNMLVAMSLFRLSGRLLVVLRDCGLASLIVLTLEAVDSV